MLRMSDMIGTKQNMFRRKAQLMNHYSKHSFI